MAALIVNNGEVIALSYLVGKTASTETLKVCLYTNNITPAEGDTAGTYTVASGGGYADATLTAGSWTVTGGAPTQAVYGPTITWTFTGALSGSATVYGYYIVRNTTGDIVGAENFSTPFTPAANGDYISLNLTVTGE